MYDEEKRTNIEEKTFSNESKRMRAIETVRTVTTKVKTGGRKKSESIEATK